MPIKRLVLEPPINMDWFHRPLQAQIKTSSKSKLVFVNDVWLDNLKEVNKSDVLILSDDNTELLLTKSILQKNANLKKLVESYFKLNPKSEHTFNRNTLLLFLKLLSIASEEQNCEPLDTLKKWFKTATGKLGEAFKKINIGDKTKQLKQALEVFASNPKYTEAIINFLWDIHGENKVVAGQDISSIKHTLVAPVNDLQLNTYQYLLFSFCCYSKGEVYIDSDVGFELFKPFVVRSLADMYIYRYAQSNDLETTYLAAHAEDMWSSIQNRNQSSFMSWVASIKPDALNVYSARDFDSITTDSPYILYLGRYFAFNDGYLCLSKYEPKSNDWVLNKFDLYHVRKNTIEKHNVTLKDVIEKIEQLLGKVDKKVEIQKSQNVPLEGDFMSGAEVADKLEELSKNIDKVLQEVKSKSNLDTSSDNDKVSTQMDEVLGKIEDLQHDLKNINNRGYRDPDNENDWEDLNDTADINKQFNDALSKQESENFIDFDS